MDVLLSTGEQVSIALLAMALNACGCRARSYTGAQSGAHEPMPTRARILGIDTARLQSDLDAASCPLLRDSRA